MIKRFILCMINLFICICMASGIGYFVITENNFGTILFSIGTLCATGIFSYMLLQD